MIEIDCRLHDGRRAAEHHTSVRFFADGTVMRGEPSPCRTHVDELQFSEPLGRIPRRVTFADGAVCEIDDHEALERALGLCRARGGSSGAWLHALESRWRWAVLALVLSVGLVYLAIDDGIPWLSARVAPTIPHAARLSLGEQALDTLDRTSVEASALPQARREVLRRRFSEVVEWAGLPGDARVEFRRAPDIGANALALPGGIVVITDALVELAQDDDEIVGVMAHEIGHVAHFHGMRQLLQNTGISVVVVAVSGDVSWLATAVPTTLLAAKYSRAFERDADRFARDYMDAAGIDPRHFVDLLERMTREAAHGRAPAFLASHPGFEERAETFR